MNQFNWSKLEWNKKGQSLLKSFQKSHADLMDSLYDLSILAPCPFFILRDLVNSTCLSRLRSCLVHQHANAKQLHMHRAFYTTNILFMFRHCVNPECSMNSVNSVRLWMDGCTAAFISRLWLKHSNESAPNVYEPYESPCQQIKPRSANK